MEQKEYMLTIIKELANNEERLSKLYEMYAREFPPQEEFWKELVLDEKEHSQWIETLREKIKEGEIQFGENRFNIDMVRDFFKEIQKYEVEVERGGLSLEKALENAIQTEENLIERKFFEVFKEDSMSLEVILSSLEKSTENHLKKIKSFYKSYKRKIDES